MIGSILGSGMAGDSFGTLVMRAYHERTGFWSGAASAARREQPVDATAITDGLVAGTLIATETGWQRAEDLRPGDRVVTFDNGLQPLRATTRCRLTTHDAALPRTAWPLLVPAGALGNRRDMVLLPEQAVLIESDRAEELYGDPFALIGAAAMEGVKDIARIAPEPEVEVVLMEFEGDEIVYAEGMLLVQCPRRQPALVATVDELMESGSARGYRLLPRSQGRALFAEPLTA